MPLFMARFGYTPESWAGLVRSPENREEAVGAMIQGAGGKLHSLWYAFGDHDGVALLEAPDNATAAGIAIAITSSGAFRSFDTTVLMTQAEMLEALGKASEVGYTAPGAAVHA
jgi:uncharacterized protein with GYD domain